MIRAACSARSTDRKDGVREQVDNLSANEPSLDQTIEFQNAKSRL